jgi:hypothetical protein
MVLIAIAYNTFESSSAVTDELRAALDCLLSWTWTADGHHLYPRLA